VIIRAAGGGVVARWPMGQQTHVTQERRIRTIQPDYSSAYSSLKITRDARGVLVAEFHADVIVAGEGLSRAIELAYSYLKAPEVTRRNTRALHAAAERTDRPGSRLRIVARGCVSGGPGQGDAGRSEGAIEQPYLKSTAIPRSTAPPVCMATRALPVAGLPVGTLRPDEADAAVGHRLASPS
jgi:hypothetical protein